jgi:serine/threonine-protein kinase RsbW
MEVHMRSDSSYGSEREDFTVNDLQRVRALVEQAGQRTGLSDPKTGDLVTAVNEIVINAVSYAGGNGSITIAQTPDGVCVKVQDSGPGLPSDLEPTLPAPESTGGRGLWLAKRLCRRLSIVSSSRGVTVWLFMPVGIVAA